MRGKQSPALHGRYTAQEALNQALAGSGLAAESVADDMIAVNETAADQGQETPTDQGQETPTLLPTITVTGQPWGDTGYNALDSTTRDQETIGRTVLLVAAGVRIL